MSIDPPKVPSFSGETLRIRVKAVVFTVHKELLCGCSPYIAEICADRGITDELTVLEGTNPPLFQEVLSWIYSGKVDCPDGWISQREQFLIDLWLLAEALEIPNLQNQTMLILKQYIGPNVMEPEEVCRIYKETRKDSPLRAYAVDTWVQNAKSTQLEECLPVLPRRFIADLSILWIKDREQGHVRLNNSLVGDHTRYFVQPGSSINESAIIQPSPQWA